MSKFINRAPGIVAEKNGHLCRVEDALKEAKQHVCDVCQKNGASIWCKSRGEKTSLCFFFLVY